jgi:uncharacterized protein
MGYYVKSYESFIAVCDSDIIGKKFEEGEEVIDVTESFFKGDLVAEKEVKELLQEEYNFILVGNGIIKLALELDLVDSEAVKEVKGVKHAQVYCL